MLRFIAVALITNSHFDGVYPINISFGGALGVATFFLISGFLLRINRQTRLLPWIRKRLLRIYPSVWVCSLFLLIVRHFQITSVAEAFTMFVFPTRWWYVKNVILLYIPFYLVRKYLWAYKNYVLSVIVVMYLALYVFHGSWDTFFIDSFYFRLIYGFVAMILGAIIREHEAETSKGVNSMYICFAGLSVVLFLGSKYIQGRFVYAGYFQVLSHVSAVLFAYFSCRALMGMEQYFRNRNNTMLYISIAAISNSSLEVYFCQHWVISMFKEMAFPLNFTLIIITISVLGYVLNRGIRYISSKAISGLRKI